MKSKHLAVILGVLNYVLFEVNFITDNKALAFLNFFALSLCFGWYLLTDSDTLKKPVNIEV